MDESLTLEEQAALAGYEHDFFLWTEQQAALLRLRTDSGIDWENVAEEIESLGRRDKREVESRLEILILHLLKWSYQPAKRKGEWESSITTQRSGLWRIIDESPSLRRLPDKRLNAVYPTARRLAFQEMGLLRIEQIPDQCPFSIHEIMDYDWLPDAPSVKGMSPEPEGAPRRRKR